MYTDERIEQFRKMAQANPDDDLAHFALGHALVDAERHDEAINVFRHVLKLNKHYSKAYVLMGQSQLVIEDEDAAIETFQRGYAIAMHRGDLMPATEMKAHLTELGATISNDSLIDLALDEPAPDADREPGEGEVRCIRTRRIGQRMEFEPFADEIGAFIKDNVSKEGWDEWIEMSIKVINELRLDLGDVHGQKTYDEHMRDFLNLPANLFEGRYTEEA